MTAGNGPCYNDGRERKNCALLQRAEKSARVGNR